MASAHRAVIVALMTAALIALTAFALPSLSAQDAQDARADCDSPAPLNGPDADPGPNPAKQPHRYPNLDQTLQDLVDDYEFSQSISISVGDPDPQPGPEREDAAVAVSFQLEADADADALVSWLGQRGVAVRNSGEDFVEASLPLSILGPASEQPGVLRVDSLIPPRTGGRTSDANSTPGGSPSTSDFNAAPPARSGPALWGGPQPISAAELWQAQIGLASAPVLWHWDSAARAWSGYALVGGKPVPGSCDFVIDPGDTIWLGGG